MRFLVDECLSRHFVVHSKNAGHDLIWVQDTCPAADDQKVLALATAEDRIVISQDLDFGELVIRFALPAKGVVIVPVQAFEVSLDEIARYVTDVIEHLGQSCEGTLTVIERPKPANGASVAHRDRIAGHFCSAVKE